MRKKKKITSAVIFMLIPILTIIAVLIVDFLFKNSIKSKTLGIDALIK